MKTETKHASGPWKIGYGGQECDDYAVITSPHVESAIAHLEPAGYSPANARLIAAAPELLEALRFAVKRVELANAEGDPILSAWLPDAKAAIAKAAGGDS